MIFIADLIALLEELRTAIDNHDHYAAEEVATRMEQLVRAHSDPEEVFNNA